MLFKLSDFNFKDRLNKKTLKTFFKELYPSVWLQVGEHIKAARWGYIFAMNFISSVPIWAVHM